MSIVVIKTTPLIPIMSIGCKYVNKSRDIMHFKSIYANERNNHYGLSIHFCFLFVVSISKISHTPRITAIYFTFHSTRLVYKHSEQNHYLHWTTMDRAFSNWKIAVSILFFPPPKTNSFCSLLSVYFHREMGLFYYYYYHCYY